MSLCHRSAHAAAWPASKADQPCPAASWEAATADFSGLDEVRAVSTPTYLTNSYDSPERTGTASDWLALRSASPGLRLAEEAATPAPGFNVEATVPAVPVVSVLKVTSTVGGPLGPPPVWTSLRAPAPSMRSVTVAWPSQCGVTRRRTAPTCGCTRSAMTS